MNDASAATDMGVNAATTARSARMDRAAIDSSIRTGLAWTGIAKWMVQAMSWASTILVVRLLAPSDYGIVAMASVFVGVLQPLCDFGIAATIVQDRTLTNEHHARLNGFAISLGAICAIITAAAAVPIASFFDEPVLRVVVPVMGLSFLAGAFRIVPGALLVREMRFRGLAAIETIESLAVLVVTFGLALWGKGYWSLVIGTLSGRVIGSAIAMTVRPIGIRTPHDITHISRSLRFGAWVATSSLAWYAYTSADRVVVGRFIGGAALGAYTIAMTLAAMPVEKISQLYQRVAEAVISEVQNDRALVAHYLVRITEGVATLSFPISIGLALVADQFVAVVLGDQWTSAIVPMRLLAVSSALRALDPLLAQVLIATGHARENARSMALATAVLPLGFFVTAIAGWGLAGVATVWLLGHPAIVMSRQIWCALHVTNGSFAEYIRALWPPLSCTTLMTGAVVAVRALMDHRVTPTGGLVLSVAVGVVAYAAALLGLHPARLRDAWSFARGRRAEATTPA